ncbi:MAG TPA: hypothetical protein VK130_07625 [Steroidobacteraceae bacterium]|nr:hypothetical protein [Steroidobacteraceae bacterium]
MAEQIEGVPVRLGGRVWLVPAINFKRLRRLLPKLLQFSSRTNELTEAALDDAIEVVHLVLTQNYPDLTLEQVEEMMNLRILHELLPIIMGAAGMVEVGEAQPAALPPA